MEFINLSPNKQIENYAWNHNAHLGSGSFGKVYLGKNLKDNSYVAIKVIEISFLKNNYMIQLISTEIELMKKLNSKYIVKLIEVLYTRNNIYMIQEFCEGGDLRNYLKKTKTYINEKSALLILKDLMNGLKILYENGIVHRDLKPENILIKDGIFKIGDFGLSKAIENNEENLFSSIVGTPLYMSPQILKSEKYTNKCDIWSLGVIFYEILFLSVPWTGKSQYELIMNITKKPLRFKFDHKISHICKIFIKECLEIHEIKRIGWDSIFSHQLFNNDITPLINSEKNIIINNLELDSKISIILLKLQELILKKKICLINFFESNKESNILYMNLNNFSKMIKICDPLITIEEINYIFNKLDYNSDKHITIEEFEKFMTELDFEKNELFIFDNFNENHGELITKEIICELKSNNKKIEEIFNKFNNLKNYKLDINEFSKFLLTLKPDLSAKEIDYVFKKLDKNKNNLIEKEELTDYFMNIELKINNDKSLDEKGKKIIDILRKIIFRNQFDIDKIFNNFDRDGNGCLEINEFKNLIRIFDENLTDNEIIHIFNKFDTNGSKTIELNEFKDYLVK